MWITNPGSGLQSATFNGSINVDSPNITINAQANVSTLTDLNQETQVHYANDTSVLYANSIHEDFTVLLKICDNSIMNDDPKCFLLEINTQFFGSIWGGNSDSLQKLNFIVDYVKCSEYSNGISKSYYIVPYRVI